MGIFLIELVEDMTDQELIEKILTRDRRALYKFYRSFVPKVERWIKLKITNPRDAEEVLQDALFACLEGLRDFTGRSSLQTYLFAIAQHKVVDYYRRKKFKTLVFSQLPEPEELVSSLAGPEEHLNQIFLTGKLRRVFRLLLPHYERILKLKYQDGLSASEIAAKLALTLKSVESQLFRARKAFVEAFNKHG